MSQQVTSRTPPQIFGKKIMMRYGSNNKSNNKTVSSSVIDESSSSYPSPSSSWSPTQKCYRSLLVAIREAYYYDRAKLFWARHRLKVEVYKYRSVTDEQEVKALVAIGGEIARFIDLHMKFSVQRVVDHNEAIQKLPVDEAKKFRLRYLEREEQHEIWCKTKIKMMMRRRPPPPYPFC